ncbi:MAG: hypothetical protein R2795_02310 [Saprospiraceae bacterium]
MLTTTLENLQPGTVYEASVWTFNNHNRTASLVVSSQQPGTFHIESSDVQATDAAGWQQHLIRFHIPFQQSPATSNATFTTMVWKKFG